MELLRSKTVIITVILVVIGAVWYMSSSSNSDTTSVISTETTNVQDQSLVSSLLKLRSITLTGDILTNPAFQSLKDNSTQIVAEPVGRPDPFLPLAASVQATTKTTQGAQIFKSPNK